MRNDIISTLSSYISNDINLCCRFSLTSWFQFGVPVAISPTRQDIDKETSMLEGFLSLILILLSQRVFIGEFYHRPLNYHSFHFHFQIFKEGSPSAVLIFKGPSITKINK